MMRAVRALPALLLAAAPASLSAGAGAAPNGESSLEQALQATAQGDLNARAARGSLGAVLGLPKSPASGSVRVGPGFQVHLLRKPQPGAQGDLCAAVEPTGIWRFLILGPDRPLGLVTLSRVAGTWRVVEMGAAPLAALLAPSALFHPGMGSVRFLRVPAARQDFLEIRNPGQPVAYQPLTPGGKTLTADALRTLLD